MRFNAGYFGACAVVLALLGTVLAGYVMAVEKETVSVTNYDYITDVSGLFDYDETPEYVNYNPSSNFVGYTTGTSTPKYTQTATANNYRIILLDSVSTPLGTWTQTVQTPAEDYGPMGSNTGIAYYGSQTILFVDGGTKLSTYLDGVDSDWRDYDVYILDEITNARNPLFIYGGEWNRSGSSWSANFNDNNAVPTKVSVDTASGIATAYRNDAIMFQRDVENVGVFTKYIYSGGIWPTDMLPINTTFVRNGATNAEYGFMDPTAGVTIDRAQTADGYYSIGWANGYENNSVSFKVIGHVGQELYLTLGDNIARDNKILIAWALDGSVSYYTTINNVTSRTILGYWPAVQVTLSAPDNTVRFTPTADTSLLTTAEDQPYTHTVTGLLSAGNIEHITFAYYGIGYPATWQITNTSVFLNTYNLVMNDPSINIKSYFPDLEDYRLNFYSFALMGDSFTINGTDFVVNRDNATVTFTYLGAPVTQKLANFYVSVEDDYTYLTFANVSQRYDLGETTTHVISFDGYWFFTTGLYEPYQGTKTVYNWDLNGSFHANAGQCLVIFFAILGGCVLIAHTYARVPIRVYDWIIIIFAGFFAYVYFGGLIV